MYRGAVSSSGQEPEIGDKVGSKRGQLGGVQGKGAVHDCPQPFHQPACGQDQEVCGYDLSKFTFCRNYFLIFAPVFFLKKVRDMPPVSHPSSDPARVWASLHRLCQTYEPKLKEVAQKEVRVIKPFMHSS